MTEPSKPRVCPWCDEPCEDGIWWLFDGPEGERWHKECQLRMLIGSLAHVERRCACFVPGADEGDDPALSKRENARLSYEAFRRTKPPTVH